MKLKLFGYQLTVEVTPLKKPMARLCIRIVPNNHPTDPSLDVLRTQEGDVVEICGDDHKWSEAELNCGQYKFVDVEGKPEDYEYLKASVYDVDEKMIARRAVTLDKEILETTFKNTVEFSKADIDSIVLTKTFV